MRPELRSEGRSKTLCSIVIGRLGKIKDLMFYLEKEELCVCSLTWGESYESGTMDKNMIKIPWEESRGTPLNLTK